MLSTEELKGMTALVTGAGQRLGRAIACALAGHGVRIVAHFGRSADAAQHLVSELQQQGVGAWCLGADLTKIEDVSALFERATAVAGPVDILINNASIFPESSLTTFTYEDLDTSLRTNTFAPLVLSRAFAGQGRPGVIVNMLDTRIWDYDQKHAAYHLSKRMLFSLTKLSALEFAPRVRVNGIAPGLVLPPAGKDESYLQSLAHTNPLNRYGGADDVTEAVRFLVRSDFMTGQILYVDGGRHLRGHLYE